MREGLPWPRTTDNRRLTTDQVEMKIEFNGRFVKFRLELLPPELKWRRRLRLGPPSRTLTLRRQLLRELDRKFKQTPDELENA